MTVAAKAVRTMTSATYRVGNDPITVTKFAALFIMNIITWEDLILPEDYYYPLDTVWYHNYYSLVIHNN